MMLGQVKARLRDDTAIDSLTAAVSMFQVRRVSHASPLTSHTAVRATCMTKLAPPLALPIWTCVWTPAQSAYTGNNITRESMYAALNGDVARNVAALRHSPAFAMAVNAFLGEANCLNTRARCRLELAGMEEITVPDQEELLRIRAAAAASTGPSECVGCVCGDVVAAMAVVVTLCMRVMSALP